MVMTLEGWTNDVARPVMQNHPYAWVFFVVYIVITTFMVLNLFIGVVVNAMQEEASKADAEELAAEREINSRRGGPYSRRGQELAYRSGSAARGTCRRAAPD
jgi:voltage-gated sodium channel